MVLGLFKNLQEQSDKFRDYITSDENAYIILIMFGALFVIFLVGWNAVHKNDR